MTDAPSPPTRRYHPLEVLDAWTITPAFRRIRLRGAMAETLADEAPAAWIKLYPDEGGQPSKVGRAYTIRAAGPQRDQIDIDLLVDHEGPLSRWGRGAKAGERVFAAGPGRGYRAPPGTTRHLLLGDASAVPAILAVLESLPAGHAARALVSVDHPAERQPVAAKGELALDWLLPDGARTTRERLLDGLSAASFDAATYVWTAADVDTVSAIRRHCLQTLLHPRSHFHGAGYWKTGERDFSDPTGDWT